MKILCVIDSLCSGGAQRQLTELALGFKEKGNIVSFLTYHHNPFYNPVLEKAGISIACIQEPSYFKRIFKMKHFIRHGRYDAVLSFLEASGFICEFAGIPFKKWRLVVGERSANPNILFSVKLKMYRWFHFFADHVVANSNANMKLVRTINPLLPKSKCKVIYNAVDFNRFKPIKDFVYRKDSKIRLVIAGWQTYEKNLNGLVESIALLSNYERNKITVEWYGDNIAEPYLDDSFVEANNKIKTNKLEGIIKFYPATPDISKIFQNSDVIGLFSFYEGLPNTICEGMACAKPVICSAVSDLPYILSYDKNLLFDPIYPQSIRKTLSYIINLSNEQLIQIGAKNEKIARDLFNKDIIIPKYLQLLQH